MEKTIKFSIFKEKIIKTNELLHLHLEKTRELAKVQKCYQELKTKLEISKNDIRKFKLKDDTVSYNLKLTEKKYTKLQEEHEALKVQFNHLEQEFNETVNNLQINYQTTSQELKECKDELAKFEEKPFPIVKPKSPSKRKKNIIDSLTEEKYATLQEEYDSLKLKFSQLQKEFIDLKVNSQETSQELQKCKEKLVEFEKQIPHRKKAELTMVNYNSLNELKQDKQKLIKENSNLKLEVYELKQQRNCLQDGYDIVETLKTELSKKEQKISDLENNLKEVEGNKTQEIDELTKQINKLKTENEKLQRENSSFKLDIAMLQANDNNTESPEEIQKLQESNKTLKEEINKSKEIIKKSSAVTRHKSNTPTAQEIEEIMKDITFPPLLSPFTEVNEETCFEEPVDDLNEEIFSLPPVLEVDKTKEKHILSSSGKFKISKFSEAMKISTRKKIIRRKKSNRKKSKKVDLYKTLLALKKANINFIISNETLNPIDRIGPHLMSRPNYPRYFPERRFPNVTFSTKLECNLECCKSCHMLLKNDDSLLGFFDVKSEKPSCKDESNRLKRRKKQESKVQESSVVNIDNNEIDHSPEQENVDLASSDNTDNYSDHNEQSLTRNICKKKCIEKSRKRIISVINNKKRSHHSYVTRTAAKTLNNSDDGENFIVPPKKRIAHAQKDAEPISIQNDDTFNQSDTSSQSGTVSTQELPMEKVKTKFKRPVCSIRKSPRLLPVAENNEILEKPAVQEDNPPVCPSSPTPTNEFQIPTKPKIIPLDRVSEISNKMPPSKIEVAHAQKEAEPISIQNDDTFNKSDTSLQSGTVSTQELPVEKVETKFKRPVCSIRKSPRLLPVSENNEILEKPDVQENNPPVCPSSPTPSNESQIPTKPKIIPLDRVSEMSNKMPPSKIEVLFNNLINYSMEEEALNEVVRQFVDQDPEYIAQAILEKISQDIHDTPTAEHLPAPLMTNTQRIMLGFMSKLEKSNVIGVFDSYLSLAEHRLLTNPVFEEISPITRLYLGICKLHKDLDRMRKLCCDVCYFCGDFAVPFLFYVVTSWTEVLPSMEKCENMPLAKVLVQIVYMKDCNKPGYNLLPLRDLLIKFYGYPSERWDSDELFQELFHGYLRNPVRSSDFALLLFCKNHPEKWVHEKIEQHLKPLVDKIPNENFKAAVIILIGNLYHRFDKKAETNYLTSIRQWLASLITESTPDVVKRSVYLCLNRLAKK